MKNDKAEKEKILTVADKLFRENGLYKTSMDELAALLMISKKTIYKHFPSKENLVKEITKFWMTGSTERVDKIVHSKTDVVSKFVKLLEDYSCDLSKVSDKWVKDFQIHYPDIWKSVEKFREEKIFYYARKLFKQGMKEKYIANNSPVRTRILSLSDFFLITQLFTSATSSEDISCALISIIQFSIPLYCLVRLMRRCGLTLEVVANSNSMFIGDHLLSDL